MRTFQTILFGVLLLIATPALGQSYQVETPEVVLQGIPFEVSVTSDSAISAQEAEAFKLRAGTSSFPAGYDADAGTLRFSEVTVEDAKSLELRRAGSTIAETSPRILPGWVSILPPLLAIAMALVFRRVVPALFVGVWLGAMAVVGFSLAGAGAGLLDAFQVYVLGALADESHAAIILFSLMIGGMVGIISKNGGTQGVVNRIVRWAQSAKRAQIATSFLGIAIFFDDYANTLVVGNTMRPVTDRLRISREKLAYLVDSTAAPVSCLAFVTTWIGYEVGLIGEAVAQIPGFTESAYSIFLSSLPYNFYPILAIFFVFAVAITGRDFGPMLRAERRARETGQLLAPDAQVDESASEEGKELAAKEGMPQRAVNAVLPILVLVIGVLGGLYVTGAQATGAEAPLREIIGEADSYKALMWASLLGVLAAAMLSLGQRILTLEETVEAWYGGLKAMLFAMIILVLAWALSDITSVLHTADYLVSILGETIPPGAVPAIIFVLSALTAFATGSSWGTMGILMPLIIPLVWAVLQANTMADPAHYHILYSSVACVLAGSVWGDHCSPISDTTILSSMASGCDHIDHVRTQLPYALSVGIVAILLGTLPAGFGMPWWIGLPAGAVLLGIVLRYTGRTVDEEISEMDEPEAVTATSG